MCPPLLAAIPAGLQAAVTVAAVVAQQIESQRQARAQDKVGRAKAKFAQQEATAAAKRQHDGLRRRETEKAQAAASEVEQVTKQALKSSGLARVSAAVSGAAGLSVAGVLADVAMQESRLAGNVERRREFEGLQFQDQSAGFNDQLRGRLFSSQFLPAPRTNLLGAALNIGAGAVGAINDNTTVIDGERQFV